MGATYKFTCPSCGYTVNVDGGKGTSKMRSLMTISCENCQELSNVALSEPPSIVLEPSWKPPKKNCPNCNSNLTNFWQHPGECPKCGKIMDIGEKVAMWD